MRTDYLLSSGWRVAQAKQAIADTDWMDVELPSGVHEVLLREGRIPDPYFSDNASKSVWVGESDWVFSGSFEAPSLKAGQRALLQFDGIDTLAEVRVNGAVVLNTDNMFREYSADITDLLGSAPRYSVEVRIASPAQFIANVDMPEGFKGFTQPSKFLRKSSGDFTVYLGARPHFLKVGIHRPVRLTVVDASWIDHLQARASLKNGVGTVAFDLETGGASGAMVRWTVSGPDGSVVARSDVPAGQSFTAGVPEPELWWPWTHGAQPLYQARAELVDGAGSVLDTRSSSFAFRTIEAMASTPGNERFGFIINGQPIFLRGANWVPLTGISHVWDRPKAEALLDFAQRGNMNALRVWGGGNMPEDDFYDECDRRGILVWQDFMFEYGLYPTRVWSEQFDATVEAEVAGVVKRLRNHPSILLWCGGNEVEMSWDFQHGGHPGRGFDLFEETMGRICAELDDTRLYHVNSPVGGPVPNWPLEGDWHDYDFATFSTGTAVPLFTSESGRASTPTYASMQRFLPPEELWPEGHDPRIVRPGQIAWPQAWGRHAPDDTWNEIHPIEKLMEPSNAWELVRAIGLSHGEYLRDRYERSRRGTVDGQPQGERQSWGVISWRLNDPWPVMQFSVLDSYMQPKIAYYYLKRAFEPVLISFEPTLDNLHVWLTNDAAEPASGTLVVRRQRFDGRVVKEHSQDVTVAPGQSLRLFDASALGPISLRHEYVSASFAGMERTWLLISERYLQLPQTELSWGLEGTSLVITAPSFVRQVSIEALGTLDVTAQENWFDLPAGASRTIALHGSGRGQLRIGGLNTPAIVLAVDL